MPRGVKAKPVDEAEEVESTEERAEESDHRTEKFERTRPDGTVVIITRDVDTGEQKVTEK